jgi:aminoglycoside phosphotransferase (APT) family kinase protein
VLTRWTDVELPELLASAGLSGVPEEPFPTDGWSGATFSRLRRADGARFVLKRDSFATNWIVRATADRELREAMVAVTAGAAKIEITGSVEVPYLGAARDGDGAAILMRDLSGELVAWEDRAAVLDGNALSRVIDAVAALHAAPLDHRLASGAETRWPWCPLRERLLLLTRPSAQGYADDGIWVGERFLAGWDAFDRRASAPARQLIESLSIEPGPLIAALGRLPSVGLHGDLKLSNVGLLPDRRIALIDWQMTLRAPVAVEIGWFLVSNVALLPLPPSPILDAYGEAVRRLLAPGAADRRGSGRTDWDGLIGDWAMQADLSWIIGLLLRGWRKGLDAHAGLSHPSGVSAVEDLAWWCAMAVEAADRRL